METTLTKIGNSYGIIIGSALSKMLDIGPDRRIDMTVNGKVLEIQAALPKPDNKSSHTLVLNADGKWVEGDKPLSSSWDDLGQWKGEEDVMTIINEGRHSSMTPIEL